MVVEKKKKPAGGLLTPLSLRVGSPFRRMDFNSSVPRQQALQEGSSKVRDIQR